MKLVEINQVWKNKDMDLIPFPADEKPDVTPVLLDPMDPNIRLLLDLIESDEFHDIFKRFVKIDNQPLNRHGPQGVMQVKFRM